MNNLKNVQRKCPYCGSTDISLDEQDGLLRCNYCRRKFQTRNEQNLEIEVESLQGNVISEATKDIDNNFDSRVTIKCSSCGAEVVIDTSEKLQARCHWCKNTLSINNQIPNGVIPDMVLPFCVTKNEAYESMNSFLNKYRKNAKPEFLNDFKEENIMGVYLPYMVVDVNSHVMLEGYGEKSRGKEVRGDTFYDAELYSIKREFDLAIDNLTVESSQEKLDQNAKDKTNNIINSIMPFDMENSVLWDANYLKGYNSEKRDLNVDNLKTLVDEESKDVARYSANETIKKYDRGVKWTKEEMTLKGERWKTAYLPVWLYSYSQKSKFGKNVEHYIAVNGRTKETMGSIPLNSKKVHYKIQAPFILVGLLFLILFAYTTFILNKTKDYNYVVISMVSLLFGGFFLFLGIMLGLYQKMRYRNKQERHYHEKETKNKISNVVEHDDYIKFEKELLNPEIIGKNNDSVKVNNRSATKQSVKRVKRSTVYIIIVIILFIYIICREIPGYLEEKEKEYERKMNKLYTYQEYQDNEK